MDDPRGVRNALRRGHRRRVPAGSRRACARCSCSHAPGEFRGHHRRHFPLPSRAHGVHPHAISEGKPATRKASPTNTPLLKPILDVTYGCMVYQEQVMQIVRDLAGLLAMAAATWCAGPWPRKSTTSWSRSGEILRPRHGGRRTARWSCAGARAQRACSEEVANRSSTR